MAEIWKGNKPFLNEGMRAGIPDQAAGSRTITLYLNTSTFRHSLAIPHEQSLWLYLFEKSGKVLWQVEGAFNQEKEEALLTAVGNALPSNDTPS